VVWDGEVMGMTSEIGTQPDMTADLPSLLVTVALKQSDEIATRKITRQSQAGMTSSLTV